MMHYLICDIIDHNDAMGPSVVTRSDGAEPLLSSSVPLSDRRLEKRKRKHEMWQ